MACRELRQISSPFHLQGTVVQAVNEDGKLSHSWVERSFAFDVYGTLVDPLAIADHLKSLIRDRVAWFAELWRPKQLEYSFRRGLMRAYKPFLVCTRESLVYTEKALGIVLPEESRTMLTERYNHLPAFPDAASGLASIRSGGHYLAAFSNGEAEVVRGVLENAQLLSLLMMSSAWTR
jgi:2-haloacid dehalogenase